MSDINNARLVLVRGLPGSGKSTLAREIATSCGYLHFENDMYFETPDGYVYDRDHLPAAQKWCFLATRDALMAGRKVVVSNVFSKIEHMRDFLELTDSIVVIERSCNFGSVHDVPAETISRMRSDWKPFPGAISL